MVFLAFFVVSAFSVLPVHAVVAVYVAVAAASVSPVILLFVLALDLALVLALDLALVFALVFALVLALVLVILAKTGFAVYVEAVRLFFGLCWLCHAKVCTLTFFNLLWC